MLERGEISQTFDFAMGCHADQPTKRRMFSSEKCRETERGNPSVVYDVGLRSYGVSIGRLALKGRAANNM
jgi:hypothetical protein